MQVSIDEAKSRFAQLIEAVERGEEVVISRSDKPVARIVPEVAEDPRRKLGWLAGTVSDEVIDYLTRNPALDLEIEQDFMDSVDSEFPR